MKKMFVFTLMFLSTAMLAACSETEETERLQVVATTTFVGDMVEQIAGDLIDLHVMMGPGIDPHDYVPMQSDTARLQAADLVVVNGLNLEERMGQVLANLGEDKVLVLGDYVSESSRLLEEDSDEAFDPHIWFDLPLWSTLPPIVASRLGALAPEHASTFNARAEAYVGDLRMLDGYIRGLVAQIPEENRVLITAHDAFAYLGRAYGLEVFAIQGISTEGEASIADIEALAQLMKDRQVTKVFFETTIPEATINALVEAANALDHEASVGGSLFSDATGSFEEGLDTLMRAMRHNMETILSALGA